MAAEVELSRRVSAERLIATGRIILAGGALLALWLDPSEPVRYAEATYAICIAYLAFALAVGGLAWSAGSGGRWLGLTSHLVDLPVFTLLLYLTDGPTSPFFAYFVFAVLSATLRWRWKGALWTGTAVMVAFVGVGLYADLVQRDPDFEYNRFLIRNVYLVVVTALVGYIGAFEDRLRREIGRLAVWRREIGDDDAAVRAALVQTVAVCEAPRAILVWDEAEEPWRHLAWVGPEGFEHLREPPDRAVPILAEALQGHAFLCADSAAPEPLVIHRGGAGLMRWHGAPLEPAFRARFAIGPVLGAPLVGAELSGHLLLLDRKDATSDDLDLVGIVARQVAADLDQIVARRSAAQRAGLGERIRLGRDLHDGVLQALSGIGLQLGAIRRDLGDSPAAAAARLERLERLVTDEQRELRFFIQGLRPLPIDPGQVGVSLLLHLRELGRRVEAHWGLAVSVATEGLEGRVNEPLAQQAYRLVQEALVNAARHGAAITARVRLAVEDGSLAITVSDDGRGFAFRGRYDLESLKANDLGPVSLRERVAGLGGSLTLESSETGTTVTMGLPLGPRPAEAT